MEHVRFDYPGGPVVLEDVSLTIPVGRSTAIVGFNGAGKTTLVKLLTALYQPTGGRVSHDGRDLAEADPASWQRHFAVAFQDFARYPLTLRENVAMSAIRALDDDAGIVADLDRAGLAHLVESLPDGLDTPLSRLLPGGRDLSGGQWQRLALARSLFAVRHGAGILVLDEPTAQLDARGEAGFYDSFVDLTRGVTSIIISHRFSSVRRADQIAVLDDGWIRECGTHAELLAADGLYARMFRIQASRFTTGSERA
jgi:ATP-binding cassette subfamily B protein